MGEEHGRLLAGRYRVLGLIGRGGMGAVWRARDTELDRVVAVKELRLPDEIGEDERRVLYARLGREARVAAKLRHPGIVTAYDRVTGEDGRPLIVMELVEGPSLDDVLRSDGPLPVGRVADIGRQMVDALTAAHAQGVVHRDVKPANVLLEGDRVVLTDFGIAAVEGDATLTKSGTILGTPAYMAPEQVRGEQATPRSDLWSLGATLYAAVEGRPPFPGTTHGALFVAIVTENPQPPTKAGPLTEILTGLLRKDPDARLPPESVRDRLTALAAPPKPPPVTIPEPPPAAPSPAAPAPGAPPPGAPPQAAAPVPPGPRPTAVYEDVPRTRVLDRPKRRRGRVVAIVLGVLVVLAAAIGVAVRLATGHSAVPGTPSTSALTGRTIAVHRGAVTGLAFSPDGGELASAGADNATRIRDVATGKQLAADAPSGTAQVAFSPDGKTLATDDRNGDVELIDPATRKVTARLTDPDGLKATSMAFGKDGKSLAVGVGGEGADNSVRIWDVPGHHVTTTISGIAHPVTGLAFSGTTVAYGNGADIRLWDTSGRAGTITRSSGQDTIGSVAFGKDGRYLAAGGTRGSVQIWAGPSVEALRTLPAGAGGQVAFGPDGTTVAARATENANDIRLWNARTGKPVRLLTGLPSAAGPIAFSPDGTYVAAGDAQGNVRVWPLR